MVYLPIINDLVTLSKTRNRESHVRYREVPVSKNYHMLSGKVKSTSLFIASSFGEGLSLFYAFSQSGVHQPCTL
jgi:hypothetical protein